jgi:sporulation protein YlmC with PRC-barrel domain
MRKLFSVVAGAALVGLSVVSASAQEQQPAASEPAAGQPAAGQLAKTGTVAVSQLKLVNGIRASKVIGAPVYNDANDKIGSVDDLIITQEDKATAAVIQVGGFLGAGGKLVAVPYDQLHLDKDGKAILTGATKDSLAAMPSFTYGG